MFDFQNIVPNKIVNCFQQEKRVLENVTFRELILVHQEMCQTLVQKLLDT